MTDKLTKGACQNRGQTPFHVYSAGRRALSPGDSWGPGIRSRWLLCLVEQGSGMLQLNGNTYELHEGDFFSVPPDCLISLAPAGGETWEYTWLKFGGTLETVLTSLASLDSDPVLPAAIGAEITPIFREIVASAGVQPWQRLAVDGLWFTLFSRLIRANGDGGRCALDSAAVAAEYIIDHFEDPITVEWLASYVGISHSSLYRRFVERYGVSPKRFLLEYRVEQACRMLRHSNCSVQEIAFSVGFEDPFYFSRAFKEIKGVSPRQFANSCAEKE